MVWFLLNRRTGEAGGAEFGTIKIWLNADTIQFFQKQGAGTRIYLRTGAIDSVDVVETFDEVFNAAKSMFGPDGKPS
jgi:hypothetical protein